MSTATSLNDPQVRAALSLVDNWHDGLDDMFRLGWHHGYDAGRRDEAAEMQAAWSALADKVRERSRIPPHAELVARRNAEPAQCASRCGRCSACICFDAWLRRSRRWYEGAEAERARGAA